jgi:RimK family alpha-L-glutamate ligase
MQRVSDRELAWRTFRVLEQTGQLIYQQKFIPHPGHDLRVFVMSGKVRAAMKRISANDWRTNVAQGGRTERAELTAREAELAVRAAEAVGCPIAGVDLLPGPRGELYVIEVNAVPGWKALAATTGLDIARMTVSFLTDRDEL